AVGVDSLGAAKRGVSSNSYRSAPLSRPEDRGRRLVVSSYPISSDGPLGAPVANFQRPRIRARLLRSQRPNTYGGLRTLSVAVTYRRIALGLMRPMLYNVVVVYQTPTPRFSL